MEERCNFLIDESGQAWKKGMEPGGDFAGFDDDGRPKRTGSFWTANAHIITAVIGSGILSLGWSIAQLGWIAGPAVMLSFSIITYYTSVLLAACYRTGDPVTGKRNYTYPDAVQSILGGFKVKICRFFQCMTLFGASIGYTITAVISIMAIKRASCYHNGGGKNQCRMNANPYMIGFGIMQIILSQIPGFSELWWLSIVATVMSFTYSFIGLGLGIAKVAEIGKFKGTIGGVGIGTVTKLQKVWRVFQALGNIAFAYSYAQLLVEIQDTIKSPPSEEKTMNKATLTSIAVTSIFYFLCGCFSYGAFGNSVPGNLLTDFGFHEPYWLLDIANAAIVIHLVGAYQVYAQPLFAFIEIETVKRFPSNKFITREIKVQVPAGSRSYNVNLFRLGIRTLYVIITTLISMLMPFFNEILGLIGAFIFWPLTVYFPIEMYSVQKKINKWSSRWIGQRILSLGCLLVSLAAAAGCLAGIVQNLKSAKPFHLNY